MYFLCSFFYYQQFPILLASLSPFSSVSQGKKAFFLSINKTFYLFFWPNFLLTHLKPSSIVTPSFICLFLNTNLSHLIANTSYCSLSFRSLSKIQMTLLCLFQNFIFHFSLSILLSSQSYILLFCRSTKDFLTSHS